MENSNANTGLVKVFNKGLINVFNGWSIVFLMILVIIRAIEVREAILWDISTLLLVNYFVMGLAFSRYRSFTRKTWLGLVISFFMLLIGIGSIFLRSTREVVSSILPLSTLQFSFIVIVGFLAIVTLIIIGTTSANNRLPNS